MSKKLRRLKLETFILIYFLSILHTIPLASGGDSLSQKDHRVPTHTLHIALQDGFAGESVTIMVNAQEVYRKQGVQTRWQIGYADAVEVQVPAGSVEVQIAVESRQAVTTVRLQVTQPMYVGVSLTPEGTLTSRVSLAPFGYL